MHKGREKKGKEEVMRIRREVSAGIVVYRRTRDGVRYLLLYHGGRYWNFPKGHIEIDQNGEFGEERKMEESMTAAFRETEEETGIPRAELRVHRQFRAVQQYAFKRGKIVIDKKVIFYLAEAKGRKVVISDEHEGFGWFLYGDARHMLERYKGSSEVLKKARAFLSQPPRPRPETSAGGQPPAQKPPIG